MSAGVALWPSTVRGTGTAARLLKRAENGSRHTLIEPLALMLAPCLRVDDALKALDPIAHADLKIGENLLCLADADCRESVAGHRSAQR